MSDNQTKKAWTAPAMTTLDVERTLSGNTTVLPEGQLGQLVGGGTVIGSGPS